MPRFPRLQASFVVLLLWESACHKRQVAVPLPNPPAGSQTAPSAPAPSATTPETASPGATKQESTPYQVNKLPEPPPAPARKPSRSAAAPASAPAAAVPAPVPPAPAVPPPKLGDILTPEEQRQYGASIDQSLSHAQTSLNAIAGRQLDKAQQAEVDQIRNFIQQAQATRNSDLAGAKSLAERAEVLARDLAATFH